MAGRTSATSGSGARGEGEVGGERRIQVRSRSWLVRRMDEKDGRRGHSGGKVDKARGAVGIEQKIECHGVFPPSGEHGPERESEEATTYLTRGDLLNYASVEDNKTHAKDELRRYEENGYMKRLTVEEANDRFKKRTLSKLGLILKEREDGSMKKRIVDH